MADISISLDETLELDTIIKESSIAQNPINNITYSGSNSKDYNMKGIETHTSVFDPQQSGTYTIDINGQELSVEVTDPSTIPDSGVSRWTFDNVDTANGESVDTWGDNNGTLTSVSTGQNGLATTYNSAESYEFDGSNSKIDFSSTVYNDYKNDPWTVGGWLKADNVSNIQYAIGADDSTNRVFQLRFRDSEIQLVTPGGTGSLSHPSVSADTVYHAAVGYDGNGNAELFVDGDRKDSGSVTFSNSSGPFTIGYIEADSGNLFNGQMDDIQFYDKLISEAEASDWFNNGTI